MIDNVDSNQIATTYLAVDWYFVLFFLHFFLEAGGLMMASRNAPKNMRFNGAVGVAKPVSPTFSNNLTSPKYLFMFNDVINQTRRLVSGQPLAQERDAAGNPRPGFYS